MNESLKTLRHQLPIINLPRGNYTSNLWLVYSHKLQRELKLYTDLKYHHWITIESNPKVSAFCESPIKTYIVINGIKYIFFVDMWVQWSDGREEYREIILSKNLDQKLSDLHKDMCVKRGVNHCVVTEKDIYANNLYINNWIIILNQLSNTRKRDLSKLEYTIADWYYSNNKSSIYNLTNKLSSKYSSEDIITVICRLLHNGTLYAHLDIYPFDLSLEVSCGRSLR